MSDFEAWLRGLGLERHLDVLEKHDIDLDVAADLSDADLERLSLSLGHRRKFLAAAARLRASEAAPTLAATAASAATTPVRLQERRQVTVVFADLVGSAALASRLDPEDMQHLLQRYRDSCAAVVARYEGHVAQYLGDGILAYFGYPLAVEGAAERAVRAGLEITRAVGSIARPDGHLLQARLGIASGLVVSDAPGPAGEQTVVGDTPNLAARLQALATPGTVLVSESTRRLTGDFFEFARHGEHALKGYAEPQPCWTAVHERAVQSRFAASRSTSTAPMVGRERELSFLLDAWRRARDGDGHLVLVCGEAGMGKSRLLETVAGQVQSDKSRLLRCQCSPHHRNSALHPFGQMLRHALEFRQEHGHADKLARVDAMLDRLGRSGKSGTVLMADLLDLPTGETLSAMEMTAAQRQSRTLEILEDFIVAEATGSLLLLVEDAHWIDPTSATLLGRLLKRIDRERILALISNRPEWTPDWQQHPSASVIRCKPLARERCAEMVRALALHHALDDAKVGEIVARSDGVPLFVEELTKAVIDARAGDDAQVPATLRDSLMARLDRLDDAKAVAQVAAVAGREFELGGVMAMTGLDAAALTPALDKLLRSGLVFEVAEGGGHVYSFSHALIQEEAYQSLPRTRRVDLHRCLAAWLQHGTSTGAEAAPELVAHHWGRAGDARRAFDLWLEAAARARQRCAFAESIAHLHAALAEAARIPEPSDALRCALQAQLQLGATLLLQRGPQVDVVAEALAKARALASADEAGAERFQATWGLYLHAASNRRFGDARRWGSELDAISERLADADLDMEALHHRWGIAYFTGDTPRMLEHTEAAFGRYDAGRHHRFAHIFGGHDLGVCAHCVHGIGMALAGRRPAMRAHLDASVALAETLEHPVSLAFSLGNASTARWLAGDAEGSAVAAERLLAIGTRYDFVAQRALGEFMLGLFDSCHGDARVGAARAQRHFEVTCSQGFLGLFPTMALAEALARAGHRDTARDLLNRTLEGPQAHETGIYMSELWRQRGALTAAADGPDSKAAERDLRTALRIATAQRADVYRLRAGAALARLLVAAHRSGEARTVLAHLAKLTGPDPDLDEVQAVHDLCADSLR